MRILFISKYPPIQGGISAKTYWLAQGLAERGIETHVVTNGNCVESEYRIDDTSPDPHPNLHIHFVDPDLPWHIPYSDLYVPRLLDKALQVSRENEIDLIAISTHGRGGISRWALGSVADKVFRTCGSPAMLVRGELPEGKKKLISRILVPLDGSEASTLALPYAEELALKLKVSVTIFQMAQRVHPFVAMDAQVTADFIKMGSAERKWARGNVLKTEKELRAKGIPVTHKVVVGEDAATAIIETSKEVGADLIVMSTRGQSPITSWVLGSTAEKVLRQGDVPIILVR